MSYEENRKVVSDSIFWFELTGAEIEAVMTAMEQAKLTRCALNAADNIIAIDVYNRMNRLLLERYREVGNAP